MKHCVLESVIGPLTIVADGDSIVSIYYPGHWGLDRKRFLLDLEEPRGVKEERLF